MSRLLLLAALGVALRAPTARAEDGFCAAPLATGEAADCASPALRRAPLPLPLSVDSALLSSWITRLANFSDSPAPAVTRLVYTAQDLAARRRGGRLRRR